jgi:hypothetical protein
MNNALMFSSKSDEWETPQDLYDQLHAEFNFDVDAAATAENTKCPSWYGPGGIYGWECGIDAMLCEAGHVDEAQFVSVWAWCNPPYSRGLQSRFIEAAARRREVVMLLPARTDTKAFHAHIWDGENRRPRPGVEVRFIKGRLKFGGCKDAAPFPSMVVVFRPRVATEVAA